MDYENINKSIMISKPSLNEGHYLLYHQGKYTTFFNLGENIYEKKTIPSNETPLDLIEIIDKIQNESLKFDMYSNTLKIKGEDVEIPLLIRLITNFLDDEYDEVYSLFGDLAEVYYAIIEENDYSYQKERIEAITDEQEEIVRHIENLNKISLNVSHEEIQFSNTLIQKPMGILRSDSNGNLNLVGKLLIKKIEIISDKLGLFEPVYNMEYTHLIFNQERKLHNLTFDELVNFIDSDRCILGNDKTVRSILNQIIFYGANVEYNNQTIISAKTDLFKKGFFYDETTNKVLQNGVFEDLKPTKEEIAECINLVNELLANRGTAKPNDASVFRFMSIAPFSWCLKQIGLGRSNYAMVLVGKPQTNKTGSCENFSYLYSNPSDTVVTADTVSTFGSRVGENTLPTVIDEAYNLVTMPEMEEPNKRVVYNMSLRSTKNRTDNNKIDDFKALSLPVYTFNPPTTFKPSFKRRYHINDYDNTMLVSDAERQEFEKKYRPNSPKSPLKKLINLGKAFADKLIPYIENESEELYNLEELTIKIYKEISAEVGVEFDKEIYQIKQSTNKFDIEKDILLKTGLSDLFRKVHRKGYKYKGYHETDFISCASNNEISWLKTFTRKDGDKQYFVVHKKGFEQEASRILGLNTSIQEAFELLDIHIDEDLNKEGYQTSKCGVRGAILSEFDLIYKLFGISVFNHTDLIEDYENKKQFYSYKLQGLNQKEIMEKMEISETDYQTLNKQYEKQKEKEEEAQRKHEREEEFQQIIDKHS